MAQTMVLWCFMHLESVEICTCMRVMDACKWSMNARIQIHRHARTSTRIPSLAKTRSWNLQSNLWAKTGQNPGSLLTPKTAGIFRSSYIFIPPKYGIPMLFHSFWSILNAIYTPGRCAWLGSVSSAVAKRWWRFPLDDIHWIMEVSENATPKSSIDHPCFFLDVHS